MTYYLSSDVLISIHKALASLDSININNNFIVSISIHKALASLDLKGCLYNFWDAYISIHKALASLDLVGGASILPVRDFNPQGSREPRRRHRCHQGHKGYISIHKALASLDAIDHFIYVINNNFNPQGSHEPRLCLSTRPPPRRNFNPQGSREPRPGASFPGNRGNGISIHKALASLDDF